MSKAYELRTQVKNLCLLDDTSKDTQILQYLNMIQWQLHNMGYFWRDLQTYTTVTTTELMTLNVAPSTAWAVGDTITGATSTKTCVIVEVLSTTTFNVKNRSGTFTLGEVLSNGTYTADQGTAYPTFTANAHLTVPSNISILYDIRQTESSPYTKLTYLTPSNFNKLIPQPTDYATGSPTHYTWWGGRFWWYPIPDDSYDLTLYYYKKPTNMKIYTTGTVTHSGLTVTGSSTYWLDNLNVDTNMFFTYDADMRSDGTYTWTPITAVSANGTLTVLAYTGADTTGTYICSSASTFSETFDLALIYGSSIILAGQLRELSGISEWLKDQFTKQISFLAESQTVVPDHAPILENFSVGGLDTIIAGNEYKYPFIKSNF